MLNADITGFVIAVFVLIWAVFTCWLIARRYSEEIRRWDAMSESLGRASDEIDDIRDQFNSDCEDIKRTIREQTRQK